LCFGVFIVVYGVLFPIILCKRSAFTKRALRLQMAWAVSCMVVALFLLVLEMVMLFGL
jgi:hypothetical protein